MINIVKYFMSKIQSFYFKCAIGFIFFFTYFPASAQTGKSLSFDGLGSYVSLPLPLNGSYTKEAWLYPLELNFGYPQIFTGTNTALFFYGNQLSAGHLSGGFLEVRDPIPTPVLNWVHVAVSFDAATGSMKLYKNGLLVSSASGVLPETETMQELSRFQGTNFFKGQMDEVRFWNTARTASEILADMNCELTGDEPGLVAYYNFNQGIANGNNSAETILLGRTHACDAYTGSLHDFSLSGNESNWVGNSPNFSNTCTGNFPNIVVKWVSVCINNGENMPSTSNGTDFGDYTSPGIFRSYLITNTGSTNLMINQITITGTNATDFTIVSNPANLNLSPGQSSSFTVKFISTGPGERMAQINITTNLNYVFNFSVQGKGEDITPVRYEYFSGEIKNKTAYLYWKTSFEQDNTGFTLLRSNDGGASWQEVAWIASKSAANGATYQYQDQKLKKGSNLYRLKQKDNSGNTKYSNWIHLFLKGEINHVTIYPNPVLDKAVFEFDAALDQTEAILSTVSGKEVMHIHLKTKKQTIYLGSLLPGIYFIKFANGETYKMLKD